jgi:nucleoside-diphosphate-sugar epimerase
MSKSILIIGGAGYIGPIIAEELLADGHSVTVLDRLVYDNKFSVESCLANERFRFIQGDMGDISDLTEALAGVSDVVILAGLVGDPITKKYPEESKEINDLSLKKCIKFLADKALEHTIFVSTCSNYGLLPDGVLADESYPTTPLSLYAKSKVENEQYLLSGLGSGGFSPTVLRFATAFGVAPRMRFDLTINEFTRDIALGKELLVFDPDTWRPYCHVRDFAEIIRLVLAAPKELVANEIFNAGSENNNFTKRQVVELITKYFPFAKIEYREHGTDPRNYKVNFSKIREMLAFEPRYSVEMGILEVLDYVNSESFVFNETNENYYGNYVLDLK